MPTSATGIWNSPTRVQRGFTLIEILVVMMIVGIMVAGTVLSVGLAHGDRDLEKERDRVVSLIEYMREQATLQSREIGIRCFQGGYEFLVYARDPANPGVGVWQRVGDDPLARARTMPRGLELELAVDGRKVALPEKDVREDELAPQILLFSSGEMNLFELTLRRESAGAGTRIAPSPVEDRVEAKPVAAGAP
jgi:general secretion pathway protein H